MGHGSYRVYGRDLRFQRRRQARDWHRQQRKEFCVHILQVLTIMQWRLDWAKGKLPGLEVLDYTKLGKGETVTSKLQELCPGGVDVCLECAAGEYPKGWGHTIEIAVGLETDTSELVNEMITSTRAWGRCGLTGVYSGFTNHFNIGSLMERGIALIGCGQAPCHKCKS